MREFKVGDTVWFFRTDRQRITGDYHAIFLNDTYLDYSTITEFHEDGYIFLKGWEPDEFWSFHLYHSKNEALRALDKRCKELFEHEQLSRD